MGIVEKIKKFPLDKFKFGTHGAQGVMNTIAWILAIAIVAKPGGQSGATYFYFFLTWITFPALIYNTLVPLWERTKRFSNLYATAGIDVIYTIFWVAAFASVQSWTNSGLPDSSQGYCTNFAYGDQDKCVISYGTVAIGVLMFICWFFAGAISVYNFLHLRKHGSQRPSISKPIEPKFVYPDNASSHYSENSSAPPPATRIHDLEKGPIHVQPVDGSGHPGRKFSWGQSAPNTAPAHHSQFPEAKPVFRPVNYGQPRPRPITEASPLTLEAPKAARYGAEQQGRLNAPPRLQLWGPQGDRAPSLVMDYGSMHPRTPLTPNVNAAPYNLRGGRLMRAPSTAYGSMYGGDFLNGYRFNNNENNGNSQNNNAGAPYGESVPPVPSYFPEFNGQSRKSIQRVPAPGPASYRAGGYSSGFNTPLPTSLLTPANGNSWRQEVERNYQQQFAEEQGNRPYAL